MQLESMFSACGPETAALLRKHFYNRTDNDVPMRQKPIRRPKKAC